MSIRMFMALTIVAGLASVGKSEDNVLTPEEKAAGFELLFNGKDLERFEPRLSYGQWIVEEGAFRTCLFGQAAKYVPPPHLFTAQEFGNYILKVDFKLPPEPKDTHSGIILRVEGSHTYTEEKGLEINIFGAGRKLGLNSTGSIRHELQAPSKNALKGGGAWNQFVITMQDNRLTVDLNGAKINELNLDQWDKALKRPDGSDTRMRIPLTALPKKDSIGFRTDHGAPIWYKNVKIKTLP